MPPRSAFAGKNATPTAGERQQHACTDEIVRNATLHARENASSFFNGVSTLAVGDSVKDKDSLPQAPARFSLFELATSLGAKCFAGRYRFLGGGVLHAKRLANAVDGLELIVNRVVS
jgi:hypothetical protein